MIKIYPSKISFSKGEVLQCEYNNQCQRYQIFMLGKYEVIDPKYQKLGALWEDIVSGRLDKQGIKYEKEISYKMMIDDNTQISGRVDYMADDVVLECKASFSRKFLSDVIKDGKVKLSHLAQISAYYILTGKDKVKLLAGWFKEGETPELKSERFFKIRCHDSGDIYLEKTFTGYNIKDLVTGALLVSNAIKNKDLMQRPEGAYSWQNVCTYCKYHDLCNLVDSSGLSHKEAIEKSKEIK